MAGNGNLTQKNLGVLIEERGQRVLHRFRQVAVSGVSDPKLLEVLRFVGDYWKDNFRPAFASFCCEAVGGRAEAADDVSLMITLTSAGGGIHDDIIDKSSNKHFRMTVLGKYGLDYALLVGDLLIQKGWMMARNLVEKNLQSEKLAEIIEVFGRWTLDVCEAEFMEIQCRQNLETELEHYQNILCKSMADTQACARLGAIMGGGSKSEVEALAGFGSRLGFMYRLTDDLKDTLNIEMNLSNRLRNESVPLPILYTAKNSKEKKSIAKNLFETSATGTFDLKKLLEACIQAEAFDYVHKKAKETARKALHELDCLKASRPKSALALMIKDSLAEISNLSKLAT
jgi:geranylgeranyl pyrophosphate synthase